MMKRILKKRSRLGFTLAELLAVIAILMILIGLGVPGFIALRRSIKITEYDDTAREIYVAAQNQLAQLAANGLDPDEAESLKKGSPILNEPSDFDGVEWKSNVYQYTKQGEVPAQIMLPLGSIADPVRLGGCYVIEYNPETLMVYSVFYAEREFHYPELASKEGFRTSRDIRKQDLVGYYGGSPVQRDGHARCDTPVLSIINNDILQLNIQGVKAEYAVHVTVSDGVNQMEVPANRIVPSTELGTDGYSVLLDSLVDGQQFKDFFKSPAPGQPGLTPGADLNITVTFTGQDGDHTLLSSSASITANSLFETRTYNGDGNDDLVTVAYARHLQNLDSDFSGLNDPKVADARQTANIFWPAEDKCPAFQSIHNPNLNCFDGSSLEIRYLRSEENGLFADTREGASLSGIRIVNPQIVSTGTQSVGVLVGELGKSSEVTNCGVYCSKYNEYGRIDYDAYGSYYLSATGTTGGLIGSAEDCKITNSFSALPSMDAPIGGGLIGSADGCTIENSYANFDNLPENKNFFYFLSGSGNTVTHCYAMGNQAVDSQGAFCNNGGAYIWDCYYAVSHLNPNADPTDDSHLLAPSQFLYLKGNDPVAMTPAVMEEMCKSGWGTLSAPLSHPYIRQLDGRAFPFPAIGALDHYGSWPVENRLVNLSVQLLLENRLAAVPKAALVQVYDVTVPNAPKLLLNTAKIEDPTQWAVDVPLGTKIRVEVRDIDETMQLRSITYNDALQLIKKDQDNGKTYYSTPYEFPASQDIAIDVLFKRTKFLLTLEPAVDPNGQSIRYYAIVNGKRWDSPQSFLVDMNSPVDLHPTTVNNCQCVVKYSYSGSSGILMPQEGDAGLYKFTMPEANANIQVEYTADYANVTVNYYLRDPESGIDTPLKEHAPLMNTRQNQLGAGTVIDEVLVGQLAQSHCPILDGIQVFSMEDYLINGKQDDYKIVKEGDKPIPDVTVDIYLERVQCEVTLKAGENVGKVSMEQNSTPVPSSDGGMSVTKKFFYGAKITAGAERLQGQFLAWEPNDSLILRSASQSYTFQVPYYENLTMTASAGFGKSLVTLNLLENDESWLYSSPSRQANNVTIWLKSSKDGSVFPMENVQQSDSSYIVTKLVPSIADLNQGYYVYVTYEGEDTPIYFTDSDGKNILLTVRNREETADLHFYSVSYDPKTQYYEGILPESRTYPQNYTFNVPTGALRNKTPGDENTFFCGWKDSYATPGNNRIYLDSDRFTLTRKTDFFANWAGNLNVVYDGNGMTSGNLPVDNRNYAPGQEWTVKENPTMQRTGYTFEGWALTPDADTPDYQPNERVPYSGSSSHITLYAVWEKEIYDVTFCDMNDRPLTDAGYSLRVAYMDSVTIPDYPSSSGTAPLQGWRMGDKIQGNLVVPGQTVTITGPTQFYPVFNEEPITVSFWSRDGSKLYGTQKLLKGFAGYLECPNLPAGQTITAWSTEKECSGDFCLCDATGRSLNMETFTSDVNLYAVDAKVYNYEKQTWYNTLYDAVKGATADNQNLIVYGDTEETQRIEFTHNLYVLANGSRTVRWVDAGNANADSEYVGLMYVQDHTVAFGKCYNNNSRLQSLEGNRLTFDANDFSRVMAIGPNAVFHMYNGVTLTNGNRNPDASLSGTLNGLESNGIKANNNRVRSYCGGGVYAGGSAQFYMHGGTVSHCDAFMGGGVYLYTGSKMTLGDMVHPSHYSATATYYRKEGANDFVSEYGVGSDSYTNYYVTQGSPSIEYCIAHREGQDNFSYGDGGGGLMMLDLKDGDLTLYRGRIYGNHANANGGGILTDGGGNNKEQANKAKLRIYEVDISHNSSNRRGGGIFQWQGILFIYNSTLRQNYAKISGGGIYLHRFDASEDSNIDFYYGDIADNQAVLDGGGVYVEDDLEIKIHEGANLRSNVSGRFGGGAYLAGSNARIYLSSGTVSGNVCYNQQANPTPNDFYLTNGAALSPMDGGIYMSGKVYISCDPNAQPGRTVVDYSKLPDVFKTEDADFFQYKDANNGGQPFVITPTEDISPEGKPVFRAPLILQKDTGKLREVFFHWNIPDEDITTSIVANVDESIPVPTEPDSSVTPPGDSFLVAWAYAPDAIEEEYLFLYDPVSEQWRDKDGNWFAAPQYTVTERYSQNLYAIWQPYSVYYVLNTENEDAAISAPFSPIINGYTQILAPTSSVTHDKDGFPYSFLGWSENKDATTPDMGADGKTLLYPADNSSIPMEATKNRILYAVWQKNSSEVIYHLRDGAVSGKYTGETTDSETVVKLERPRFEAQNDKFCIYVDDLQITYTDGSGIKVLDGWAASADGTTDLVRTGEEYYFQKDEAGNPIHLYSVPKEMVKLVFHGDHVSLDPMLVDPGASVTLPVPERWQDEPTKTYYRFKSWGTKQPGSDAVDPLTNNNNIYTFAQPGVVDLYPIWEECYLVTYHDGTENGPTQEIPIPDEGGETTFTPVPPSQAAISDDYDLKYWVDRNDTDTTYSLNTSYPISGNLELEAVWSVDITLNPNDGTGAATTLSCIRGKALDLSQQAIPTRAGCQFCGWMDPANPGTFYCTGDDHKVNPSFTANKHTTLIAVWSATVSFADSTLSPVNVQLYDFTAPITLPADELQATGKEFVGWADADVVYAPGVQYPVTKTVTLVPAWSATVTFHTDGGNAAIAPVPVLSISSELSLSGFHPGQKDGYVFMGWKCGEDSYKVDDTIRVESDTTLTAIWAEAVTVQFRSGDQVISHTLAKGQTVKLPEITDGYLWVCGDEKYSGGQEVTVNSNMTFEAVPEISEEAPLEEPPAPAQDEQVPPPDPAPSE